MLWSRRRFLGSAAAIAALGRAGGSPRPARAEDVAHLVLRAGPGAAQLAPSGFPETSIWGYEGRVPGPIIRVPQGERVTRRFVNELPQASTVHWHGVRLENAMDGAPEVTQSAVPPGRDFVYSFIPPDAGTYWYHPHERAWEQMARGLYGALIVEEPEPPFVDRDEVLLIDDWRLTEEAQLHEESFGAIGDWSHGGRTGNWITVNGKSAWTRTVSRHERLRVRRRQPGRLAPSLPHARALGLRHADLVRCLLIHAAPSDPRALGDRHRTTSASTPRSTAGLVRPWNPCAESRSRVARVRQVREGRIGTDKDRVLSPARRSLLVGGTLPCRARSGAVPRRISLRGRASSGVRPSRRPRPWPSLLDSRSRRGSRSPRRAPPRRASSQRAAALLPMSPG